MKTEQFLDILAAGEKTNSLGRTNEVIDTVLRDQSRLEELYQCLFSQDAWVRMRAADALEKVCREHPDWILPYIDRLARDFSTSTQASIQWHMAQIYRQVHLTDAQQKMAATWLAQLLSHKDADWIAAANAMDTLAQFTKNGRYPAAKMIDLLHVQKQHKSNAVIKRATKYLAELTEHRPTQ